jgi:hypothetical protein
MRGLAVFELLRRGATRPLRRESDPAGLPQGLSGLVFLLLKGQAFQDRRFRPAGQASQVSDDGLEFFLPQPPALWFLRQVRPSPRRSTRRLLLWSIWRAAPPPSRWSVQNLPQHPHVDDHLLLTASSNDRKRWSISAGSSLPQSRQNQPMRKAFAGHDRNATTLPALARFVCCRNTLASWLDPSGP